MSGHDPKIFRIANCICIDRFANIAVPEVRARDDMQGVLNCCNVCAVHFASFVTFSFADYSATSPHSREGLDFNCAVIARTRHPLILPLDPLTVISSASRQHLVCLLPPSHRPHNHHPPICPPSSSHIICLSSKTRQLLFERTSLS